MRREIRVRRIYDAASDTDGVRVLVDRVWPRGISKAAANVDQWAKDVAPSTELRVWYGHSPEKFEEFRRRYLAELKEPERATALEQLRDLARQTSITLLTATRDVERSQAAVLAEVLRGTAPSRRGARKDQAG